MIWQAYISRIAKCIIAMLCLFSAWGCSSPVPTEVSSHDLELDLKLWHMFTEIRAVRADVEDTFKHRKMTPAEAEQCFKRNKATLDSLVAELKEIKESQEQEYSGQIRELLNTMNRALAIAHQTYLDKRIADMKGAKEVLDTMQSLCKDIPRQRTRHLISIGCSTQQIFDMFRDSGIPDHEIQEYILQARAEQETEDKNEQE